MTYTVEEVLLNLHESIGSILVGGVVLFVGYYLYCGEAIRLGFRDKTHAIPVFANMYYFAHDVMFISKFKRWFYEIDHWLFRAFWLGILVFTILECIIHYQTLRYSRDDLFPNLSRRQYYLAYFSMQLAVFVLFYFLHTQLSDILFLISMTSTIVISVAFTLPLLINRGSQKGQSLILAVSLIISPFGFFFLFLPSMSNHFKELPFIILGITTMIVSLIYLWCLPKYPKHLTTVTSDQCPHKKAHNRNLSPSQ